MSAPGLYSDTPLERAPGPSAFKIKDLVQRTGVSKETIHFYITEGLLPRARKTSRNMAWYGDEHVERLRLIKDLQEKQFLPLRAIKAVLGEHREEEFTPDQRSTIAMLKSRLVSADASERRWASYGDLVARCHVRPWELDELAESGAISVDRTGRAPRVDAADEEVVRAWVALRDLGFTVERGYRPADLALLDSFLDILLAQEVKLLTTRQHPGDADEAARMVEQAVPRINDLLALLHSRKVRQFLADFPARAAEAADSLLQSPVAAPARPSTVSSRSRTNPRKARTTKESP